MATQEAGGAQTEVARARLGSLALRRALRIIQWPVGLAGAVVLLFWAYLLVSRTQPVSSDGASQALQAWDMLHGNTLLRGWTLTDVSFYTTELPEYMLVEAVRGLHADVLHVSAAISYALLVLTGGLLARGRATGSVRIAPGIRDLHPDGVSATSRLQAVLGRSPWRQVPGWGSPTGHRAGSSACAAPTRARDCTWPRPSRSSQSHDRGHQPPG